MEVSGTTSISQLPISSQVEQINNVVQSDNIKINNPVQSQIELRNNEQNSDSVLEQKTYNQLVSGLQQASAAGQTNLVARDIPQSTNPIVQDEQIKPNYIPPTEEGDYIINDLTTQDIIDENKKQETQDDKLEYLYEELQLPLLVGILFFLFQLPIIQKYLYKLIPSLFNTDGNANLYGYVFNSFTFGFIFYILIKTLKYFSYN